MTSVACDLEQPVVTPRTLPSLKKNSTPITCISHWLCEISSQTNLFLKFVVFFFFLSTYFGFLFTPQSVFLVPEVFPCLTLFLLLSLL